MTKFEEIVNILDMQPHPEGGFFKETYRSKGLIREKDLNDYINGKRNYCTGIYFLLTSDSFSAFHRINQDEMWHFYKGTPLKLHIISEKGNYSNVIVGNNLEKGEVPQFTVNARDWFASEVVDNGDYALVGCTVSPGFDFRDFELANRETLISKFPQHSEIITKLTRV
ncbi:cupin domain-containing protein [Seonamhaeicola sediminis]|uniref:Cupin domain-containing protein n=1 Tax=Seonamhaeicola sediminis TaxID=2528206 RepID=A0A562YB70_9FLAO|nr:cupin domain-containing protein [Seonamhaeicola sediminis]TWO31680.1 cupin domain-containing protein [Seonamhaeicola sediminis]